MLGISRAGGLPDREGPTLRFVQTTPNAVGLTYFEGVLQAGILHRTQGTNGLRVPLTFTLVGLALKVLRWEKCHCLWTAACRLELPQLIYTNCAHTYPPSAKDPNKQLTIATSGSG